MRAIWKRLLAVGLVASILIGPAAKADTLVPDQSAVIDPAAQTDTLAPDQSAAIDPTDQEDTLVPNQDAVIDPADQEDTLVPDQNAIIGPQLSSITTSAGTIDRDFSPTRDFYNVILNHDEEEFAIKVVPALSSSKLTIGELVGDPSTLSESYSLESEQYSNSYPIAAGEFRSFQISVANPNEQDTTRVSTITVRAYRTPNEVTMQRTIRTMEDGTRQLKLDMVVTPGAKLQSIIMGLKFDPNKLQLADQSNKVPTSLLWTRDLDYASDLLYGSKDPASSEGVLTEAATGSVKLDNRGGTVKIQLATAQNLVGKPKDYYEVTETSGPLITFYFKIMTDSAGVGSASIDFLQDDLFKLGCRLSERAVKKGTDVVAYFPAQGERYATFAGEERALVLPQINYPGGRIRVTPQETTYCYGDKVTLTARPNTGYEFVNWSMSGEPLLSQEELKNESLEFQLFDDLDVSQLVPIFKEVEITLPSTGATLSFKSPYVGRQLLVYNPLGEPGKPINAVSGETKTMLSKEIESETSTDASIRAASVPNEDGVVRFEMQDEVLRTGNEGNRSNRAATTNTSIPTQNEERIFKVRDTRFATAPIIQDGAWTAVPFELKAIRQSEVGNVYVWLAKPQEWQPVTIFPEDIEALADSFIVSYETLTQKHHEVRDSNNNGGLDILLYNIKDNIPGGYVGGLVNVNELYNSFATMENGGNLGDVLHLDTYPQLTQGGSGYSATQLGLATAMSTMVHETQHLAMGSIYTDATDYLDNGPPTWVNEGMSMLMEQEIFGPRVDRINTYNTSEQIKGGIDFTLESNWKKDETTLSCYSMAYLFFAYISAQSEDPAVIQSLYTRYGTGENRTKTLEGILQQIPEFRGMQLQEVFKRFYLALCLKEPDGIYGFKGNSAFEGLYTSVYDTLPSKVVPSGGALYVRSSGSFQPEAANGLQYVGVELTKVSGISAFVEPQEGGTVQVATSSDGRIEITAQANENYYFIGWKENGTETSEENPLLLPAGASGTVTACFAQTESFRLSINCKDAGLNETGITEELIKVTNPDGSPVSNLRRIPKGTVITVSFEQNPSLCNATLNGWTGVENSGTASELTITMDKDIALIADITITQWKVHITNKNPNYGSFTVEDENGEAITATMVDGNTSSYTIDANSTAMLRADAREGYISNGWGGDPAEVHRLLMNTYYRFDLQFRAEEPVPVTNIITFEGQSDTEMPTVSDNTVTLAGQGTVTITPVDGTITAEKTVMENTMLRVTAVPVEGMVFDRWVVKKAGTTISVQEAMEQGLLTIVSDGQTATSGEAKEPASEMRVVLPEEDKSSALRTVEFKVNKNISLEAWFIEEVRGDLRLAQLSVVTPEPRKLVKVQDGTIDFSADVFNYTLSLLSNEQNIELMVVRQTMVITSRAVLRQLRGERQVGEEIEIVNQNGDVDTPLMPIPLTVRDGDVIEVMVWGGGPSQEANQKYTVTIDLQTKDEDPFMIAAFSQRSPEKHPEIWTLELSIDDMQAETLEAKIYIKDTAAVPAQLKEDNISYETIGFTSGNTVDLKTPGYCVPYASSGYTVSNAVMTREVGKPYYTVTLTMQKLDDKDAPKTSKLTPVLKMDFQKSELADDSWIQEEGEGNLMDSNLQKVDPITVQVIDKPMIKGTVTMAGGRNLPTVTVTKRDGNTAITNVLVEYAGQENNGQEKAQFQVIKLEPGTYDLTIKKAGYTEVEIKGLEVTKENPVFDLGLHSDSRLRQLNIFAGELDGDGHVTMQDWSDLSGCGVFGHRLTGAEDPLARYDLDGNGIIQMADLGVIAALNCLGKENILIDLPTTR